MKRSRKKLREEARRLFLTSEMTSNAEIAAHLGVKPHTIGRWHRQEDWDGSRMKIDRRVAEQMVEKIASDRVSLNLRHYRFWDLLLLKLTEGLKSQEPMDSSQLNRIANILERAQKGQRLAKGMSVYGETEEVLRTKFQADLQQLIDVFVHTIKEHIPDEETRDIIRRTILSAIPEEEDSRAGDPGYAV